LAPGSGAIQMGGETWSKRLSEACRTIVYESVGEDELYDKYRDQEFAANATKEIEQIRRRADYQGMIMTAAIFGGNELARLTLRTPLFKLRP
jgi:hypothetical protein